MLFFGLGFPYGEAKIKRIVFGGIGAVVGPVQNLVLLSLFPLGCFLALLILASQFFLTLLKSCA